MEYITTKASHGGNIQAHFLIFDETVQTLLRSCGGDFTLKAEIEDLTTGKLYQTTGIYVAVDENEKCSYNDEGEQANGYTLHQYFYAWHWCGCHRADDITGKLGSSEECPDERYLCRKIWHPERPDLTLMYETFGQRENSGASEGAIVINILSGERK